jgi:tRNA pseudouridine65 synthase
MMESEADVMKLLRILYQDEHLVAVQKPAGMHVHPPEDARHRIADDQNCLKVLKTQLQRWVFPVHRLDRATSGVLVFALGEHSASHLGQQFQNREVTKTYLAVVRGWTGPEWIVDRPLKEAGDAQTQFVRIATVQLPWKNERFDQSRYSLLFANPLTGRLHQIRRHLAGQGNPIIGDSRYGDGHHNQLFRENLGHLGLLLHAHSLVLKHPLHGRRMRFQARFPKIWHPIFDAFGVCPWTDSLGQSNQETE